METLVFQAREETKAPAGELSAMPLAGSRFSRTAKLLTDFRPPGVALGDKTLRDGETGIGL